MIRFIRLIVLIDAIGGAQLLNCPDSGESNFEKVLGLRPSINEQRFLLYKNLGYNKPITKECLSKCESNNECSSFVIHFNTSTCYWYKNNLEGDVLDSDAAWFIKICLNSGNCNKKWIFERVPSTTLIGNDTKIVNGALSRDECEQFCLNETNFICRSIKFRIVEDSNEIIKGNCVLSDADRHLLPNSFRVSSFENEYLENQCAKNSRNEIANEFCAYEEFVNVTLSHSDAFFAHATKDECQNYCEQEKDFNCRGFSILKTDNNNHDYDCLLHSEDSKVLGPRLLLQNFRSRYYEKANCINVSIICTETYMTVKYQPKQVFVGAIYMEGYSQNPECSVRGSGLNLVTLKLPLLLNRCGILRAVAANNRTLFSGNMILQYNNLIQTQGDRLIRVGCIFGNDSKILVGTGVTISSTLSNKGSTLVNSLNSNSTETPIVEMRVVDEFTQEEISDTQIGQDLQLIIEMKQPPNSHLDIWASNLVAMTENPADSIPLLDDLGCPTNLQIFPQLTKISTNNSIKLISNFQAFKFSSSPIVRFSVVVQFCPENCPKIDCTSNKIQQKREIASIKESKITKINRSEFEKSTKNQKVPLEFIVVVKNPKPYSDKLIIGDSRILVAGYDYATDEVCLNFSLFVGLVITWILIQIIFISTCVILIKRYKKHYKEEYMRQSLEELHKNFGIGFSNLETRRVHWADNEDFQ